MSAPLLLAPAPLAQTVSGYAEVAGTDVSETTASPLLPGEPEVENGTSVRRGTITFVYQQPLWPNLAFETGGLFERLLADQRGDGVSSDTTVTRLRPYANLRWRTPLYLGELSWARNGTRAGGAGADVEITRETYGANLGWYPTTTDFLRIAYTHNTDRDQPRSRLDRQGDVLGASATYQPFRTLRIDLSGSESRQEDHIRRIRTESQAARGRLNYADAFWTGRFSVAGSYDASWNRSKFLGTEPGAEVELPVTAIQGLSVVSDLPAAVTLAANPGLIDQDRVAATGLNIGLIPPSGDRRPRNAGLDFGIAKRLNVLRVWVDRDLPRAISATFSWEIWTSSDNLRWAREHNLPSAPFGPFDFFFELRFGTIESRYVKVVVAPLDPGAPSAGEYPTIEITEIEALLFTPATPGRELTFTGSEERISAGSQLLLLADPSLLLGVNYLATIPDHELATDSLSGNLSVSRSWGTAWSAAGQLGYETGRTTRGRQTASLYGASLTSVPLPTLRWSASAGGRRERQADGALRTSDSFLVDSSANLHTGLDARADVGISRFSGGPLGDSRTLTVGAGLDITPNRFVTVGLLYHRMDEHRDADGPARTGLTDTSEVRLNLYPAPTMYIYASHSRQRVGGNAEPQALTEGSFNWSPFPLGTLRLYLRYQESYFTVLASKTRLYGPGVRWYLNPASYLDLFWERYTTDSDLQAYGRDTASATLRIGF